AALVRGVEAACEPARADGDRRERRELAAVAARGALRPRIDLRVLLRFDEPRGERAPTGIVLDDAPLHVREPDALDPRRGALEIARLLAIELQERGRMLEHLVLGRDLAEKIGRPHLHAAVAADVQLVARLDADDAEIFDRRLGAVARTAGDRELDLVRMPRAPRRPLETDAE